MDVWSGLTFLTRLLFFVERALARKGGMRARRAVPRGFAAGENVSWSRVRGERGEGSIAERSVCMCFEFVRACGMCMLRVMPAASRRETDRQATKRVL